MCGSCVVVIRTEATRRSSTTPLWVRPPYILVFYFENFKVVLIFLSRSGDEARNLFNDAQKLLARAMTSSCLRCGGVVGIWRAATVGDDIELYGDSGRDDVIATLYGLRQQAEKDSSAEQTYFCLSDFVAPRDAQLEDHIGAFAVACFGVDELCRE